MTPADLKAARQALGLSQQGLAEGLGFYGKHAGRDIRRMEAGTIPIGPRTQQGVPLLLEGHKIEWVAEYRIQE